MGRTDTSRGCWLLRLPLLLVLVLLAAQGVHCEHEPTESECRPYIEKALKEHHVDEVVETSLETDASSIEQEENPPIDEASESNEEQRSKEETAEERSKEDTQETQDAETNENTGDSVESQEGEEENKTDDQNDTEEQNTTEGDDAEQSTNEGDSVEGEDVKDDEAQESQEGDTAEAEAGSSQEGENIEGDGSNQEQGESAEESGKDLEGGATEEASGDTAEETNSVEDVKGDTTEEVDTDTAEDVKGDTTEEVDADTVEDVKGDTTEETDGDTVEDVKGDTTEETDDVTAEDVKGDTTEEAENDTAEDTDVKGDTTEEVDNDTTEDVKGDTTEEVEGDTAEEAGEDTTEDVKGDTTEEIDNETTEDTTEKEDDNAPQSEESNDTKETEEEQQQSAEGGDTAESGAEGEEGSAADEATPSGEAASDGDTEETAEQVTEEAAAESESQAEGASQETAEEPEGADDTKESSQEVPEEDLTKEMIIPDNLRSKQHITQILKLDEESVENESNLAKTIDNTLKTLKKLYDNAIKPLEILYKYRDLSNRHFGDPEIFSKPLILFMGPWSGGKSSTINYLLDLEFTELALRTGAEPSPAYFNILTYGEETEILDGTQLAADWTFSGLQKFGQGMLDRLRGVKIKNRLLEKVNIVEIPGILEIRKQVQRLFPFNDACQWFIDRADIIFLVYDPAKLDVGPETEAILDQLKGREYQTRIILNKADQVKPEELMRVQGTLIWNISPLMSSQEPPVMYTTSLWSLPYEASAPSRLLLAQERAFLRDLREAIDKRVENKIASARRFAVRVRNHAKMVDCYLTTYYNHKTLFGNRKKISDDIIENPTKYHIYEGLSTLTNISRYDLPDPEMYRDFFRINPLYEFTKLSDTCTYFRGCPINKLDVTIAYDLPELVGKYKKAVEAAKTNS